MVDLGSIIVTFVMLCFVLAMSYYVTKYIAKKGSRPSAGKYLCVLDKLAVGSDKSIVLVKVGSEYMLIGVTKNGLEMANIPQGAAIAAIEEGADICRNDGKLNDRQANGPDHWLEIWHKVKSGINSATARRTRR